MGLFDRLFGSAGATTDGTRLRPVLAGHPELGGMIDKLAGRMDVAPARAVFDKSRGRWALRWLVVDAVRTYYVAKLAEATRAQMIDTWVANTPTDPSRVPVARAVPHRRGVGRARRRAGRER